MKFNIEEKIEDTKYYVGSFYTNGFDLRTIISDSDLGYATLDLENMQVTSGFYGTIGELVESTVLESMYEIEQINELEFKRK